MTLKSLWKVRVKIWQSYTADKLYWTPVTKRVICKSSSPTPLSKGTKKKVLFKHGCMFKITFQMWQKRLGIYKLCIRYILNISSNIKNQKILPWCETLWCTETFCFTFFFNSWENPTPEWRHLPEEWFLYVGILVLITYVCMGFSSLVLCNVQ